MSDKVFEIEKWAREMASKDFSAAWLTDPRNPRVEIERAIRERRVTKDHVKVESLLREKPHLGGCSFQTIAKIARGGR